MKKNNLKSSFSLDNHANDILDCYGYSKFAQSKMLMASSNVVISMLNLQN